jgi:hypothetical protein
LTYLNAFFRFDQITDLAATVVSRRGWGEVGFSGPARAREGMTSHVYRSAAASVVRELDLDRMVGGMTLDKLTDDFEHVINSLYNVFLKDLGWLTEFANRPCLAELAKAAAEDVVQHHQRYGATSAGACDPQALRKRFGSLAVRIGSL